MIYELKDLAEKFQPQILAHLQKFDPRATVTLEAQENTQTLVCWWNLSGKDGNYDRCGEWKLTPMRGNQNILESWDSYIRVGVQGIGLGKYMNRIRQEIAQAARADLICTVNLENARQQHILTERGWQIAGQLGNVEVWTWQHVPEKGGF